MSVANGNATTGTAWADRLGDAARRMGAGDEAPPLLPNYRTARELMAEFPAMRDPVIDGLIRRGEMMNIIAAPKVGKSWLVTMLLLSVASGRAFLGRFPVAHGKALLIDNELHPNTARQRIDAVARAMGLTHDEYADNLCVESWRGQGATLDRIVGYARHVGPGVYTLAVIDAWYRSIPRGLNENDNSDMTVAYNMADEIAQALDGGLVLIHHASKGNQADKGTTDVGAGAGAQSRAADAHLVIRPHEEDDAVVVDAVARSWPPPEPFGMRWGKPLWRVDDSLDLTKLRRPVRPPRASNDATPAAPPPEPWTAERFAVAFVTGEPRSQADILALARVEGIGARKAADLVKLVRLKKLAHVWSYPKTNAVFLANREQMLAETVTPKESSNDLS